MIHPAPRDLARHLLVLTNPVRGQGTRSMNFICRCRVHFEMIAWLATCLPSGMMYKENGERMAPTNPVLQLLAALDDELHALWCTVRDDSRSYHLNIAPEKN
jgi:hypothetical protein